MEEKLIKMLRTYFILQVLRLLINVLFDVWKEIKGPIKKKVLQAKGEVTEEEKSETKSPMGFRVR